MIRMFINAGSGVSSFCVFARNDMLILFYAVLEIGCGWAEGGTAVNVKQSLY